MSDTSDAPTNGPADSTGGQGGTDPAPTSGPADTGGTDDGGKGGDADQGATSSSSTDDGGKGGDSTDWQKHAKTWETRAKAKDKAVTDAEGKARAAEERLAAVLKAAGLEEEDEDPTEAVKRATAERDQAVEKAARIEAERVAEKVARGLGADVDRLLDSKSVEKALGELEDPTDRDAVTEVLKGVLKDAPHLKATPPAPRQSGSADVSGGGGEGGKASGPSSPEDFRKLRADRRRY